MALALILPPETDQGTFFALAGFVGDAGEVGAGEATVTDSSIAQEFGA